MTKFLKILSVLVVLGGLGYGGVYAYQTFVAGAGMDPELAMPNDISMVFALDHSNSGQVKNLDKLLEKFPKNDPGIEYLKGLYDEKVGAGFSYAELEKLLDGNWKVAVGVKIRTEDVTNSKTVPSSDIKGEPQSSVAYAAMIDPTNQPQSVTDALKKDPIYTPPVEVYFAGTFSNADDIEKLLKSKIDTDKNYIYSEKNGVKYWDSEVGDIYIIRYKSMFVVTNSLKGKDAILPRIENKDGLVADENFMKMKNSLGKDSLAYFYINLPALEGANSEASKDVGSIYSTLMASNDGFATESYTGLKSKDSPIVKAMEGAAKPTIIDKVNATNIIAYAENSVLGSVLESASAEAPQASMDIVGNLIETVAKTLKVDKDDIKTLIKSPVAFVISADSVYYPSISLYLKIDEKTQEVAQKIVDAMDAYMDEMSASFQKTVEEQEAGTDLPVIIGTDEKQNFIDATVKATCHIYKASNIFDPSLPSESKAIYKAYGFDADSKEMMDISTKYSKDLQVTKAIADGVKAECGDFIPDPSKEATPPSVKLQEILAPDDSLSDGVPAPFFLKKENIDTNGMDLKHWYVDWDIFPSAEFDDADSFFKDKLMVPDGIKAVKIGFYYGFPEDGIMVVSLQPDLAATYGKTPLSSDPVFKEAMAKMDDKGWVAISYFRPENLFLIINNYVKLSATNPLLAGTVSKVYGSVEGIFSTFKYFVTGQMIEGDAIVSQGYVKVEEAAVADVKTDTNPEVKPPQGDIPEDESVQPPSEDDTEAVEPPIDDTQVDTSIDNGDQTTTDTETPPKIKRVK